MPNQKSRFRFPEWLLAWRLPNGTISASDEDLERSIASCETWEGWFVGLVVFGVFVTIGIAGYHPPYDSFWERWGNAAADSFVAFGVAMEVKFARMAGLRQSELIRRSRERAENANLEAEKLRRASAWRKLSVEQHATMVTALNLSGPGASIRFVVIMNEQESLNFAYNLSYPFRAAGWTVGFQFDTYTHDIITGILLPEAKESWLQMDVALNKRVWQAFAEADISFVNGWPLAPNFSTFDNTALSAPIAFVYVGPKPQPTL